MQYFKHLSSCASAAATELQDAYCKLGAAVNKQLEGAPEGYSWMAACGALRDDLRRLSQMTAQQQLWEGWAKTFDSWHMQAAAAFKNLS